MVKEKGMLIFRLQRNKMKIKTVASPSGDYYHNLERFDLGALNRIHFIFVHLLERLLTADMFNAINV